MSLTFTRLALHCIHPCLLLVWKRREGMASESEEQLPSYREDTGASIIWALGRACLRVVNSRLHFHDMDRWLFVRKEGGWKP